LKKDAIEGWKERERERNIKMGEMKGGGREGEIFFYSLPTFYRLAHP
jgi:hypothetical protein